MNYFLLIKTLFAAVKAIEELMPESPSKDKLEAAISIIEGVVGTLDNLAPAVKKLIGNIVEAFNSNGVFKKKAG